MSATLLLSISIIRVYFPHPHGPQTADVSTNISDSICLEKSFRPTDTNQSNSDKIKFTQVKEIWLCRTGLHSAEKVMHILLHTCS